MDNNLDNYLLDLGQYLDISEAKWNLLKGLCKAKMKFIILALFARVVQWAACSSLDQFFFIDQPPEIDTAQSEWSEIEIVKPETKNL